MTRRSATDIIGKRVVYHPTGNLRGFSGTCIVLGVDEAKGTLTLGTYPLSNLTFCGVKGEDCTISEDSK